MTSMVFSLEARPGLAPLKDQPLLILVGLTGVGKSTLVEALGFPRLPDRRELVDLYVLPRYGVTPPIPREERFRLTRRFREEFPGGVAEVLARGFVEPLVPLLFDGLRGEAEVAYALEHLPKALFVVLHAREATRLKRLLSRQDAFDRVRLSPEEMAELRAWAEGVLSPEELEEALALAPWEEVLAKLKIVAEEKRNYDPLGPLRLLQGHPRALILDTERLSLEEEVGAVRGFLKRLGL
ncbi:MAG: AAA family ATPase [Thermus sp.]|uniref:AAA family ATPase n=1 Tax=Thermus neutrinimicus TaxID=2908149 RepID=UPI001FA9BC3C|nr:AAA family ATPase [Thermus neutrinimicus]